MIFVRRLDLCTGAREEVHRWLVISLMLQRTGEEICQAKILLCCELCLILSIAKRVVVEGMPLRFCLDSGLQSLEA